MGCYCATWTHIFHSLIGAYSMFTAQLLSQRHEFEILHFIRIPFQVTNFGMSQGSNVRFYNKPHILLVYFLPQFIRVYVGGSGSGGCSPLCCLVRMEPDMAYNITKNMCPNTVLGIDMETAVRSIEKGDAEKTHSLLDSF